MVSQVQPLGLFLEGQGKAKASWIQRGQQSQQSVRVGLGGVLGADQLLIRQRVSNYIRSPMPYFWAIFEPWVATHRQLPSRLIHVSVHRPWRLISLPLKQSLNVLQSLLKKKFYFAIQLQLKKNHLFPFFTIVAVQGPELMTFFPDESLKLSSYVRCIIATLPST